MCVLYLVASMWVVDNCLSAVFSMSRCRERFPLTIPLHLVFIFLKNKIRWRDVKLCAFDNANHRTYVDLKVKTFVTLVQGNGNIFYFICYA